MQSFKNYLKEYAGVGPSSVPMSVDDTEMNMASLSNPKVIRALNSYVGAIANMEYMLPEHALRIMREKLSRIGLSFGSIPEMTEQSDLLIFHSYFLVDVLVKTKTHHMMNL